MNGWRKDSYHQVSLGSNFIATAYSHISNLHVSHHIWNNLARSVRDLTVPQQLAMTAIGRSGKQQSSCNPPARMFKVIRLCLKRTPGLGSMMLTWPFMLWQQWRAKERTWARLSIFSRAPPMSEIGPLISGKEKWPKEYNRNETWLSRFK